MTIWRLASLNFKNKTSFILGLFSGLLPAFGEGAVVIAALFILAQLPFSKDSYRGISLRATAPLYIYLVVQTAFFLFYRSTTSGFDIVITFAIQSALVAVFAMGMNGKPHAAHEITIGAFSGLILSMAILGLDYAFSIHGYACRAQAYTGNPQWAAAFLVMMAAPLYTIWLTNKFVGKVWIHMFVAASLVTVGAFSGVRMSFYVLSTFFLVCFALLMLKSESRRTALNLVFSVMLGWTALFSIDNFTSCDFGYRVASQINYLPQVFDATLGTYQKSEAVDASDISSDGNEKPQDNIIADPKVVVEENQPIESDPEQLQKLALDQAVQAQIASAGASRAEMWHPAWASIRQNILIGTGRDSEKIIASHDEGEFSSFIHVHNQYLSWLIWGGVPMLLAGLILIFGSVIPLQEKKSGLALSFTLALILMSESLFALDFNLTAFILIYSLVFAISPSRRVS